jgi:hypothetical protein
VNPKSLTIAIPTYNRIAYLRPLLEHLAAELRELQAEVDLLVCDNASTDDTLAAARSFHERLSGLRVLDSPTNTGPDFNIARCFEEARTPYVWILGDDDLPRPGLIAGLLGMLREHGPDLVYLASRWGPRFDESLRTLAVGALHAEAMSAQRFARLVHVWCTFISGVVVSKQAFQRLSPPPDPRRYAGTNLIQLGWVLPVLAHGSRFISVSEPVILATAGNTGGYAVLTVFAEHFTRIAHEALRPRPALAQALVTRNLLCYLPSLVWQVRRGKVGRFEREAFRLAEVAPLRRHRLALRVLQVIATWPRPVASVAQAIVRAFGRVVRLYDRAFA